MATLLLLACNEPRQPEATSLGGTPLFRRVPGDREREKLERELAEARAAYDRDPSSVDALIWLGRRTAYLGRFREAIAVFSGGIAAHPDDARLWRHRGHRLLTVREVDAALADLERAAQLLEGTDDEVEPDGMPNAKNIPTSTLHGNVWYHLGLAYYLQARWEEAAVAYARCLAGATTDDTRVAAAYWLSLALHRAGCAEEARRAAASVREDLEVIENHAYHRLLLVLSGRADPEALLAEARGGSPVERATVGYGVGAHYAVTGRTARAEEVWREVVETGEWPAFGHLAAEAELSRSRRADP